MAFLRTGRGNGGEYVDEGRNETPTGEYGNNSEPSTETVSCQRESEMFIYEMNIMLQPPVAAQPNEKLHPPITAFVRIRDSRTNEEIPAWEQLSRIWAYVSAVDEDNRDTFSSSSAFLSNGRLCDSPHPSYDEGSRDMLNSYLTFPDVIFREEGRYRIRINLMRMEDGGALELLHLHSRPVHIHYDAESEGMCSKDKELFRFLRELGVIDDPSCPASPSL
ncbi:MAG: hypothetical protein M1813_001791 [Trichoglossum hirsutum]|nr:MAG: hypothetical protein M1813_001791 [Trichoglossum hirsutum]